MSETKLILPTSADELVDAVKGAVKGGKVIKVSGAGTKDVVGNHVAADIEISTTKLSGVTEYIHSELVMTAQAGTPLSVIEKELAKNNQMLAFEPSDYAQLLGSDKEQTIGGVFATNMSGSRRLSAGAARDALLGVKFVNGKGQLIKSGGKVMKNVTGLDLVKLLAGSWGTLGIMSEVTFKVLPRPEIMKTILISGLSDADATSAMAKAMGQSTEVSSAAHLPQSVSGSFLDGVYDGQSITALRLEGLKESVDDREKRLMDALSEYGNLSVIKTEQSAILWQEIANVKPFIGRDTIIWKVSVAPSEGHKLVAELAKTTEVDAYYDWQGGLVWVSLKSDHYTTHLRQLIKSLGGGHATLTRATKDVRSEVDVFEPQPLPVAALSARIKAQIDPQNILNPGRMSQNDDVMNKAAV
ncbi:MAG: FAD-binding protein [Rhizobiaceae bacterium]|nr:FAD-binding protein [Rhizobiaceae bacterium]